MPRKKTTPAKQPKKTEEQQIAEKFPVETTPMFPRLAQDTPTAEQPSSINPPAENTFSPDLPVASVDPPRIGVPTDVSGMDMVDTETDGPPPEAVMEQLFDDWKNTRVAEDVGLTIGQVADQIRDLVSAPSFVELVLKSLCQKAPEVFPDYNTWRVGGLPRLVRGRLITPRFVETLVPTLYLMMGDSLSNTRWAAQVATSLIANLIALELPAFLGQVQMGIANPHPQGDPENEPKIITPAERKLVIHP